MHLRNGRATPIVRRSTIAEDPSQVGDIVWVPFPFVDTPKIRERPAVVIATAQPAQGLSLLWVLMVTSAANKGWRGDVSLESRFAECGLEVPCVVRTAKVTTIEAERARWSGTLPADLLAEVRAELQKMLI